MTAPTRCTSTRCPSAPGDNPHCPHCSHAEYDGSATVGARVYRWTYNPQYGVDFTGPTGREVNSPSGALLRAFGAWLAETFPAKMKGDTP